jgi:hypothetical protein
MIVIIRNGSEETSVNLDNGAKVQEIRDCVDELEEVGAPGSYTFAVNGVAVSEDHVLTSGAVVTFRPRTSEKGAKG